MNLSLYNQLCTKNQLQLAWQKVKKKESAGGIDRKTVAEYGLNIESNLNNLLRRLQAGKYIQQPYKEAFIPKGGREKRVLGLLTIDDKIVQTAVANLLSPIFESHFLSTSYGYRPGRGAVKAIKKVRHLITFEKYSWLVSCDIDNFFNTISHDILFQKLNSIINDSSIIELLRMFVGMGRVNQRMEWMDIKMGIPQGGIVSPLLSNFYLHSLDTLIDSQNLGYVRYADDFVLLAKTKKEAEVALVCVTDYLRNELRLSLNEGSQVVPVIEGFEFLGILFKNNCLNVTESKLKSISQRIETSSFIGHGFITKKFRETKQGVRAFYGKLLPEETLEDIDRIIMDVLYRKTMRNNLTQSNFNRIIREVKQLTFLSQSVNINKDKFINLYFQKGFMLKDNIKIQTPIKSTSAIAKRKFEYQKLASRGLSLVLTAQGLVLGKKENNLIVKKEGKTLQTMQLANLQNVTISNDGISISSNAIKACVINKISIHFLNYNGMPYAMLYSPQYVEKEIGMAQLNAYNNGNGQKLLKQFVYGKILNQTNLIKYHGKYNLKRNKEFRDNYAESILKLKSLAIHVLKNETLDIDRLRLTMFGFEGQASIIYWKMNALLLKDKIEFQGRIRKNPSDLINNMLNYGYGILYSKIHEALIKAHLNPHMSYLHKPDSYKPTLVYDLIEEFRSQGVDRVIFAIVRKNTALNLENKQLSDETRQVVVKKILERMNVIEKFRGHEMRFYEIIQFQANMIAKFLKGEVNNYRPYIKKW